MTTIMIVIITAMIDIEKCLKIVNKISKVNKISASLIKVPGRFPGKFL